jgi:hypothetical protein
MKRCRQTRNLKFNGFYNHKSGYIIVRKIDCRFHLQSKSGHVEPEVDVDLS